ncbi:FAD-binding oxidoreductase [Micromonospora aurantiaca (nom. illeg.)]|uniref:FAD-binding oxidoreductase n=1 Tax=Micromonospora aurantiaca (nom. illeg.) TaxID=47850 RepID=UPI003401FD7E
MADLELSWAVALAAHDRASEHFWSLMEDRSVRFLPQQLAPMFFSTLGQMVAGRGDAAARFAALSVLGRMHRRLGMYPYHGTVVAAAMVDTLRRFGGASWEPDLTGYWEAGCRRVLRLAERAAGALGDGPHVTVAEVLHCEAVSDDVAILTVRPARRDCSLPGQAMPVCTPRVAGQWRWLSPANRARADDTLEFHVRAVAEGLVSSVLVERVTPGEVLWLGPALDVGLSLERAGSADLLLAAGGTGLAPLRALVEQVAASTTKRRVTLVVGARALPDLYDAVALNKLQQAHGDWLTVVLAFSDDRDVEPASQGDLLSVALCHYKPGQAVYVCGAPPLIEAARQRLPMVGVPSESLHLAATFWHAPSSARWTPRQRVARAAASEVASSAAGNSSASPTVSDAT